MELLEGSAMAGSRKLPTPSELDLSPGDLWVFGYGSLMWRPGFAYLERHMARVHGYHRALCVWSWVHRGTRERPGLVLGLDRGGSCRGQLFRVAESSRSRVLEYLYGREIVTPVYTPRLIRARLSQRVVAALAFVVERQDRQYVRGLSAQEAAAIVCRARGISGPNREYMMSTLAHLEALGIHDPHLLEVCARLRPKA